MPKIKRKTVLIMAADYGVVNERVSSSPQENTAIIFQNYTRGTASLNYIAQKTGAEVICCNLGIAAPLSDGLQSHNSCSFDESSSDC